MQEIFRSDVVLLNINIVIIFVVIIVLILLTSEMVENFLELMTLLLECDLDFADKEIEMSLVVVQALLKLAGE